MTRVAAPRFTGNPFATRWVRPGAIPYFFPPGESAGQVVERLRVAGWWGQIVGAHGTGKSTLLAALLPELRRVSREPLLVALHDGQRNLPEAAWCLIGQEEGSRVVVIDGYEQLSRWNRFRLQRRCKRWGHGLLVTAHSDVGLPELYRTGVTVETAVRVAAHLTQGRGGMVTVADVAARLTARAGNLRETLFDCYDLHEQRRDA